MTSFPDLAAHRAWRGVLLAAVLNAVGMPMDLLLARHVPNMPWSPSAISAMVGAALSLLVFINRERTPVRVASAVFLINNAAILAALWITSGYWAAVQSSTPFQAHKLGALLVPLLAPTLSVGLLSIAGFAGTAIAKFYVLDPGIQARFTHNEPWIVLVFAFFGTVLLIYRQRSLVFERELLRLHAESTAAEEVARTFLHVRDYANTPIQTILIGTRLIRVRDPGLEPVLVRIDRATTRLIELSRVLGRYDALHRWTPGDESLDTKVLARPPSGNRALRR